MASSYSSDLKLELMVTGENAGTWGDKTNTNLNLVQQAIAGFEQVTLSSGGTLALVMSDGALSNARNLVIKFATATIAASTVCTIPDSIEKFYIFDCSGLTNPSNLTIKTASGTGFSPDAAKIYAAYSDGTNLNEVSLDTLGGTIGTAQVADDAITNAKIADDAIRAAQISDNAVVTAAINDDAVTQAKIADDAVGADQLANTSVTAGSYTSSSITVDAQGRITAASSGSAGGGGFELKRLSQGPSSGTHTASPNASFIGAYLFGGGGGGGGGARRPGPHRGGTGGAGGFGYYGSPISQPFSQPFTIGGGGSGGSGGFDNGNSGNAGNATTLTNIGTANAGGGGQGASGNNGSTGSAGNAPGASLTYSPRSFLFAFDPGSGGNPGQGNQSDTMGQGQAGGGGQGGLLAVFENTGA
jgi:hypothetical protein